MAITNLDGWIASAKQSINMAKTTVRTTIAGAWFTLFDVAGQPGAGVLAGTSTAAGIVPTDATTGCPLINFSTGTGYLSQVEFGNSVACRMKIFDMLFKAGAYAFNAAQTLAAQPSYSSRVPSGTDFSNTEIWLECVTAFTGNPSIAVTYTNQAGTAAKTTGTVALGLAPTVGRMIQLPLAAGDTGVQKIESVTSTVATVGTFNILVLKSVWGGRVRIANDGDVHGLDKTAMPVVYTDSALMLAVNADSTSSGVPELEFVIANG